MVWALIGAAALAAGLMAWAVRGRSSPFFGPSVWRGSGGVALTFDDGPSDSTPGLLALLARYCAPATFFLVGEHVRRYPDHARHIAAAGHQVGNHTQTHARLYLRSASFIEREIAQAQRSIEEVTGVRPRLFRAPYGVRWFGLTAALRRHGLLGVMWTCAGRDWKLPAARVARRILNGAREGAILCLHETPQTLKALEIALPELARRGCRFTTPG